MNFESKFGFVMFGVIPFCVGEFQLIREIKPRSWERVTGKIISAQIKEVPGPRGGTEYMPFIRYEFSYNGKSFESDRRRISNYISGMPEDAEAVYARYPVGKSVTVFVCPQKPKLTVLEYGVTPLSWVVVGIGIVMMTLALCFDWDFRR